MKFSKLLFTVLMLFALNSFSAYDSDSSMDAENRRAFRPASGYSSDSSMDAENRRAFGGKKTKSRSRVPSDLHQFRQATLRDEHQLNQKLIDLRRSSDRAKAKQRKDDLAFEKKQHEDRERRLDKRDREKAAKEKRDEDSARRKRHEERERREERERAKTKSQSEEQRLLDDDEALSFLKAWSKEDRSTLDSFTERAIARAKEATRSRSLLPRDLVKEVLKRKRVILECVEACKSDLVECGSGSDPRDTEVTRIKKGMRALISKGMVALTYDEARRKLATR